ncbi:P-loop ATPase, Sll1717 family [Paraburkholderia tropica]|uniref:P-loop ATPase, Sll1717 family n=1 Tax=Paraburkholderia tropica TaxID=92647 RepID=UPI0016228136|nr:hypothetical protein [Paraburkholderia tropica]
MPSSSIFGNDSGEDENPDVLSSYFVELPQFARFNSAEHPLGIVRARKGMGKSALLSRLHHSIQKNPQDIVIKVTGNELLGMGDFAGKGSAYIENSWKKVICQRICIEIGSKIGFAASDLKMSLVESAEIEGFKDKNIVSALTDRVGSIIKLAIGKGGDAAMDLGGVTSKKTITNPQESLRRYQEQKQCGRVWFLVDDVDAKYKNNEHFQELVGSFFTAIRSLAFSVNGLCIRASVRTDVWYNLRTMEDQDKLRQYVIDISWNDTALKKILSRKILAFFMRTTNDPIIARYDEKKNYNDIMDLVFEKTFPWNGGRVEPFIPIKTLSGARPRWMGQLCKLACDHAGRLISIDNVKDAMDSFGTEKVADLEKEHAHQFSDVKKLINAFRGGEREYNLYSLIKRIEDYYVGRVGDVPDIDGYPFKDTQRLGELLFKIEFISGRRRDERNGFKLYQDEPDLFELKENSDNLILWAINPSYRKYLQIR